MMAAADRARRPASRQPFGHAGIVAASLTSWSHSGLDAVADDSGGNLIHRYRDE
jgi:hypothetical protein